MGAATQWPVGFITGSSSGATTLSHPSSLARVVEIGGHAGRVPLGDLRTLELNGGRRVAGDDVGAELGQRVGGVAGDRGLLPLAAGGGEHLAELGDGGRVRAFGPLMQHVGFGFGQRRGRREGEGKSSGGNSLDREHRFSPVSKPSRSVTPARRIPFRFLVFDAHVAGALLFFKLDSQWRQTRRGLRIADLRVMEAGYQRREIGVNLPSQRALTRKSHRLICQYGTR